MFNLLLDTKFANNHAIRVPSVILQLVPAIIYPEELFFTTIIDKLSQKTLKPIEYLHELVTMSPYSVLVEYEEYIDGILELCLGLLDRGSISLRLNKYNELITLLIQLSVYVEQVRPTPDLSTDNVCLWVIGNLRLLKVFQKIAVRLTKSIYALFVFIRHSEAVSNQTDMIFKRVNKSINPVLREFFEAQQKSQS